jgi:hypothetical protein
MSVQLVAKLAVLVPFTGYLVWASAVRRPRFLSWPMFTTISCVRMSLFRRLDDRTRVPVDHWQHLVVFDTYHSLVQVDDFLGYLRRVHGVYAEGNLVYVDGHGEHRLEVADGELDA